MRLSQSKIARRVVGRKIVRVTNRTRYWDPEYKVWINQPRLELDDGTRLAFEVQESIDGHGVDLLLVEPAS